MKTKAIVIISIIGVLVVSSFAAYRLLWEPKKETAEGTGAVQAASAEQATDSVANDTPPQAQSKTPVQECEDFGPGKNRDHCLAHLAIDDDNYEMCFMIPYESTRQYCIVNVNTKQLQKTLCSNEITYNEHECTKPFQKSDPDRTVWTQLPFEATGDKTDIYLLTFDYSIKSGPGAEGILTIFLDNQFVFPMTVKSGDRDVKNQQVALFDETDWADRMPQIEAGNMEAWNSTGLSAGKHTITFRVDPFSTEKSLVEFSNIRIERSKFGQESNQIIR